jgi:hypothetical protein
MKLIKHIRTSQTLSPRNANDAAFQNFRGAFPFKFGGGGKGDAARVSPLSAEHRHVGLKCFKVIACEMNTRFFNGRETLSFNSLVNWPNFPASEKQ